jgi:hypothetical protein
MPDELFPDPAPGIDRIRGIKTLRADIFYGVESLAAQNGPPDIAGERISHRCGAKSVGVQGNS